MQIAGKEGMSGTVRSPKRPLGLVALYRDADFFNLAGHPYQTRESRQREVVDMGSKTCMGTAQVSTHDVHNCGCRGFFFGGRRGRLIRVS